MSRGDKRILEEHGTVLMVLRPSSIWHAAMEDIRRREYNAAPEREDRFKIYAFHRDHVAGAQTANDIIRAALENIDKGRTSAKAMTRLLCADPELLRKSLR